MKDITLKFYNLSISLYLPYITKLLYKDVIATEI